MMRPFAPHMIALLAVLAARAATASPLVETPEAARISLSWHAPHDMPGATSNLTVAPGDTAREDTLFLTCYPSVADTPAIIALTGWLKIRAAAGDTLGPYWQFGHGYKRLQNVRPDTQPDSTGVIHVPWRKHARGMGYVDYDYTKVSGDLTLIVAVSSFDADSLRPGVPYVLARILFRHPATTVAGTDRPVCIEWSAAEIHLTGNRRIVVRRGDRFASWNSPGCAVCAPFRGPLAPKRWTEPPRR